MTDTSDRISEDRKHFHDALVMIEELSTDMWARQIATTALRIAREIPPAATKTGDAP